MKITRLLLVLVFLSFSASVTLADGVDPLVGIRSGHGSTPITVNNPNPTFTLVVVQDPGTFVSLTTPGEVCSIAGDTCAVVPSGPDAGTIPVFQNQTAGPLDAITIFIKDPTNSFIFTCNANETLIFTGCTTTVLPGVGTDVTFTGGSVPTAFTGDDDSDDPACLVAGPAAPSCAEDFNLALGEFAVDIEGAPAGDFTSDLPVGSTLTGSVITSPEPSSALMLLFGMLALTLTKVARRAA